MDIEMLFDRVAKDLPPLMTRKQVGERLGGVLHPRTLANLDSQGKGPIRVRVGKKMAYPTVELLDWLKERSVLLN